MSRLVVSQSWNRSRHGAQKVPLARVSLSYSPAALASPLLQRLTRTSRCTSSATNIQDGQLQDGPLHQAYRQLVGEKDKHADPHQLVALKALERLRFDMLQTSPALTVSDETDSTASNDSSSSSSSSSDSFFGGSSSWFGGGATAAATAAANTLFSATGMGTVTQTAPTGVYLHGGVGCGKTFLMNLFYDSLSTQSDNAQEQQWAATKQKVHFNKFMLYVHQEMHLARSAGIVGSDAILPAVVRQLVKKGRLLCLDEFQVTDVADALILQRLFTGLWQHGCVVVATSNRPPDELYLNGLQRDRFVPFIQVIKKECEVVSMWESETDYRLTQKLQSAAVQVYFQKHQWKEWDRLFYQLVQGSAVAPTSLETQGRHVVIPQASLSKGIARFSFEDLCKKAMGAGDYLLIGEQFHTVFVEQIPVLTLDEINWVRRFITFVDSMYESNVKLILQAKTEPHSIFQPGDSAASQHDEAFAFGRTISRLDEMGSQKYLQKRWAGSTKAESKAALLSNHRATVQYQPSLSDDASKRRGGA